MRLADVLAIYFKGYEKTASAVDLEQECQNMLECGLQDAHV